MPSLQRFHPGRERGVVLFIALIVMVAMSLAAVALIRSIDTTTTVIGNLAFRQAAILPANQAIERAASVLFTDAHSVGTPIPDKTADYPDENYFASIQDPSAVADDIERAIPRQLRNPLATNYVGANQVLVDPSQNEIRYVIERMCTAAGAATLSNCDKLPPDQTPGTTVNDPSAPVLQPVTYYRVTVRVDHGPSKTTSFMQAMLR